MLGPSATQWPHTRGSAPPSCLQAVSWASFAQLHPFWLLFPHYLSLGCGHSVDRRMRGPLSPTHIVQKETRSKPHIPPAVIRTSICPGLIMGWLWEHPQKVPPALEYFIRVWAVGSQQKHACKCPWLKYYHQFAHLESILFCPRPHCA